MKRPKNPAPIYFRNGKSVYADGAMAWTDIVPDESKEDDGPVWKPGEPLEAQPLAETALRKFLILKIPIEFGRRRAQEVLADAWSRIGSEVGKADFDVLAAATNDAINTAVEAPTTKRGIRVLFREVANLDAMSQGTVRQARSAVARKRGKPEWSAKLSAWVKRAVRKRTSAGSKIESAFNAVGVELGQVKIGMRPPREVSAGQVRKIFYGK